MSKEKKWAISQHPASLELTTMLPPRPDVKEKRHQIPRQREMYMPLHSKKDKFRDIPLQTFPTTKYFNSRTVIGAKPLK